MQVFNGQVLRVATPLHAEASKHIEKLKTLDPVFYNQLAQIFPEVEVHARYGKAISGSSDKYDAIIDKYPLGVKGILQYIEDNLVGHQKQLALNRLHTALKIKKRAITAHPETFGGYPLRYLFIIFIRGVQEANHATQDTEYEERCKKLHE